MKYKAYIQSLNNFPIADWAVSAYMGFKEKQVDIFFFENIEEVPPSPYNIVVGFIEDTNVYFEKLGIPTKKNLNIPPLLCSFSGRDVYTTNMGYFRKHPKFPSFIKPVFAKRFIAGVIKTQEHLNIFLRDVPDNEEITVSEIVDFVSEYRGYIINGQLKGIYHYLGDIRVFPDMKVVDQMISAYKDAPSGYSLDVGITSTGKTLLVECNDGWSLGNYGLNHVTYSTLLGVRWRELMENRNKCPKAIRKQ